MFEKSKVNLLHREVRKKSTDYSRLLTSTEILEQCSLYFGDFSLMLTFSFKCGLRILEENQIKLLLACS